MWAVLDHWSQSEVLPKGMHSPLSRVNLLSVTIILEFENNKYTCNLQY